MEAGQRYLVSKSGSYIDMKSGAVVSKKNPKLVMIKPTNRLLLFTLGQHVNNYVPIETLVTVMYPNGTPSSDPVHQLEKRISTLRSVIIDNLAVDTSVPYIVRMDNSYGLFTNDTLYFSAELPDPDADADESAGTDAEAFAKQKKEIDALADLGTKASHARKDDEALKIRKKVYQWRKKHLPEGDPQLLTAASNLAFTLSRLQRHEEALKLRLYVYRIRVACMEPDAEELLTISANLAVSLSKTGQYEKALDLRRQVYACRLRKNAPPDKIRKSRKELVISLRAVGGEENLREAAALDALTD